MKAKAQTAKPKNRPTAEQRKRRQQQILFAILAGIIIFSWIISIVLIV